MVGIAFENVEISNGVTCQIACLVDRGVVLRTLLEHGPQNRCVRTSRGHVLWGVLGCGRGVPRYIVVSCSCSQSLGIAMFGNFMRRWLVCDFACSLKSESEILAARLHAATGGKHVCDTCAARELPVSDISSVANYRVLW